MSTDLEDIQIVLSYQEAVAAATKAYWVEPIHFPPPAEAHESVFVRDYQIVDHSDSGLVHYSRK